MTNDNREQDDQVTKLLPTTVLPTTALPTMPLPEVTAATAQINIEDASIENQSVTPDSETYEPELETQVLKSDSEPESAAPKSGKDSVSGVVSSSWRPNYSGIVWGAILLFVGLWAGAKLIALSFALPGWLVSVVVLLLGLTLLIAGLVAFIVRRGAHRQTSSAERS